MLPARAPRTDGRPRRGEALVLAVAMTFPTLAVWLYFGVLVGAARLVYAACKVVQFALPATWALAAERPSAIPRWRWPAPRDLAAGLVTGLLFAAVVLAAARWLEGSAVLAEAPRLIREKLAALAIETAGGFVAIAVFYSLVHSLFEEWYWRWFVYGRLRRRLPEGAAVALAAAAFASHHVVLLSFLLGGFGPAVWVFGLAVAAGGAAWSLLYRWSGALWGAWLSHALVDAALMWVGFRLWTGVG